MGDGLGIYNSIFHPVPGVGPVHSPAVASCATQAETSFDLMVKEFLFRSPDGKAIYAVNKTGGMSGSSVVSEGMGYYLKILTDLSTYAYKKLQSATSPEEQIYFKERLNYYQILFDKLLKGVERMTPANAVLPGWHASTEISQGNALMSDPKVTDSNSATDGDIYITWALIRAKWLQDAGAWKASPGRYDYKSKAQTMLSHIRMSEVVEMVAPAESQGRVGDLKERIRAELSGYGVSDQALDRRLGQSPRARARFMLSPSSATVGEDMQGQLNVYSSYYILSAFHDFAHFDKGESLLWYRLRHDGFEYLKHQYELGGFQMQCKVSINPDGSYGIGRCSQKDTAPMDYLRVYGYMGEALMNGEDIPSEYSEYAIQGDMETFYRSLSREVISGASADMQTVAYTIFDPYKQGQTGAANALSQMSRFQLVRKEGVPSYYENTLFMLYMSAMLNDNSVIQRSARGRETLSYVSGLPEIQLHVREQGQIRSSQVRETVRKHLKLFYISTSAEDKATAHGRVIENAFIMITCYLREGKNKRAEELLKALKRKDMQYLFREVEFDRYLQTEYSGKGYTVEQFSSLDAQALERASLKATEWLVSEFNYDYAIGEAAYLHMVNPLNLSDVLTNNVDTRMKIELRSMEAEVLRNSSDPQVRLGLSRSYYYFGNFSKALRQAMELLKMADFPDAFSAVDRILEFQNYSTSDRIYVINEGVSLLEGTASRTEQYFDIPDMLDDILARSDQQDNIILYVFLSTTCNNIAHPSHSTQKSTYYNRAYQAQEKAIQYFSSKFDDVPDELKKTYIELYIQRALTFGGQEKFAEAEEIFNDLMAGKDPKVDGIALGDWPESMYSAVYLAHAQYLLRKASHLETKGRSAEAKAAIKAAMFSINQALGSEVANNGDYRMIEKILTGINDIYSKLAGYEMSGNRDLAKRYFLVALSASKALAGQDYNADELTALTSAGIFPFALSRAQSMFRSHRRTDKEINILAVKSHTQMVGNYIGLYYSTGDKKYLDLAHSKINEVFYVIENNADLNASDFNPQFLLDLASIHFQLNVGDIRNNSSQVFTTYENLYSANKPMGFALEFIDNNGRTVKLRRTTKFIRGMFQSNAWAKPSFWQTAARSINFYGATFAEPGEKATYELSALNAYDKAIRAASYNRYYQDSIRAEKQQITR